MSGRLFAPPAGTRERTAWDVPADLLAILYAWGGGLLLVNFNTGGSLRDDRQIDLAILTPRAIHVVEVKNHRRPVIAPPNGHWFVLTPDGHRKPIVNRRGRQMESPVVQARRNADTVGKAARRAGLNKLPVYAYVLLPHLHPNSRIETHASEGVRVARSVDDFLGMFRYNEERSSPREPFQRLAALPMALGLEATSVVGKRDIALLSARPDIRQKAKALGLTPTEPLRPTAVVRSLWQEIKAYPVGLFAFGALVLPLLTFFGIGSLQKAYYRASVLPESASSFMFGAYFAPLLLSGYLWLITRGCGGCAAASGFFLGVSGLCSLLTLYAWRSSTTPHGPPFLLGLAATGVVYLLLGLMERLRPVLYGWAVGTLLWLAVSVVVG